ncbi:hypothetical protein ACFLT8_04130 [Chloroflexota bacterium]
MKAKRIYLDYTAITPADSEVVKVMLPYLTEGFGNLILPTFIITVRE